LECLFLTVKSSGVSGEPFSVLSTLEFSDTDLSFSLKAWNVLVTFDRSSGDENSNILAVASDVLESVRSELWPRLEFTGKL
jgi:hypothetical protein